MSYVNPEWLSVDELASQIVAKEDLTSFFAELDDEVKRQLVMAQVKIVDMPVDESGYITSLFLKDYMVNYALVRLYNYYQGSGQGIDDVYSSGSEKYYDAMIRAEKKLNYYTITGADSSESAPMGATTKTVPFYL